MKSMMRSKLYKEMTAKEQLDWVKDFSGWTNDDVPVLMRAKGMWNARLRMMMERGLRLMAAFDYARDYVETARQYGDYHRRTYRLPYFVERIKKDISANVAVKDAEGNTFAYVPQAQQTRRRGRPTNEETRLRALMQSQGQLSDIETEKQQAIAKLLGLEVITNPAGREKNNEELKAEREARAAMEAKMNPGLFEDETPSHLREGANGEDGGKDGGTTAAYGNTGTPPQSTIADMSQARLHLDQLAWLMSDSLKERVATVRDLRSTAASYAEQAKVMAERGDNADLIEPVAQMAAQYTEMYEQIYEDVDNELATVCYRLKHDEPYMKRFMKRYGVKDVSGIIKELKPYLQKMPPEFEVRVKALIEQESPEYIAKVKEEKAKKQEVDAILKYLRRKDKTATKKRVETSEKKFERLVELIGEEQAEIYRPLLVSIKEEYAAATNAAAKPQPTEKG